MAPARHVDIDIFKASMRTLRSTQTTVLRAPGQTVSQIMHDNNHKVAHPHMRTSGALDPYACIDAMSAIGREYLGLRLSDMVADDSKIKDLVITGK